LRQKTTIYWRLVERKIYFCIGLAANILRYFCLKIAFSFVSWFNHSLRILNKKVTLLLIKIYNPSMHKELPMIPAHNEVFCSPASYLNISTFKLQLPFRNSKKFIQCMKVKFSKESSKEKARVFTQINLYSNSKTFQKWFRHFVSASSCNSQTNKLAIHCCKVLSRSWNLKHTKEPIFSAVKWNNNTEYCKILPSLL